jgi:flavorubredoxin
VAEDRFITVKDGETLPLGNKTLTFILTPWVHWPETMVTYLNEDRILFSCDFFGSHQATATLLETGDAKLYEDAKRYYAEIMMPFRQNILNHLQRLQEFPIEIIAPSHGAIYLKPDFILMAYKDWTSDDVKNRVLLPYVSMHGSVEKMVSHFIERMSEYEIPVIPFNLTHTDIGSLAMALVDAATVVIGSPTFLVGPHPQAVYAAYLMNALRPKTRFVSVIGSYGWGGKLIDQFKTLLSNLKVEFLEPVVSKGYPKKSDFHAVHQLTAKIATKHRQLDSS